MLFLSDSHTVPHIALDTFPLLALPAELKFEIHSSVVGSPCPLHPIPGKCFERRAYAYRVNSSIC